MAQVTIQQAFDLAVQHHQAGRLWEAEQIYRQILAQQPDHADALHLLGLLAQQTGRNDIAVDLIRRAIRLNANYPDAFNNLGMALKNGGRLDDAIPAFRQAIALNPRLHQAHGNLGTALQAKGRLIEAIAAYRTATSLDPNSFDTQNNLGTALAALGQLEEAIAAYRQAISLNPDLPQARSNLGNALSDKGQLDEAISQYRAAIALNPNFAEAHNNLGNALRSKGQYDDAIAACRRAIVINPSRAETHCNLGNALKCKEELDEAIAAYRQAIALNPNLPEAYNNIGTALKGVGLLDDSIAAYRRAIDLAPQNATFDSNLVYTLHFHPAYDAHAIAAEHRRWNRLHAEPVRPMTDYSNDSGFNRRIRIGYVSPDFRNHVVGLNLLPLFREHDRAGFEIFCYANVVNEDETTRRFQSLADHWRNIVPLNDEQAARAIHDDRIDILVDTALHLSGNRLPMFARKPAPVQATFAGYPGSTGMTAIDYRLSDPYLDPPGMDESVYSEKTIRLPDSFWCYDPLDCADISVNSPPALAGGIVTFGCLNNFCKINDGVLKLWAEVFRRVENSRLILLAAPGNHRRRTVEFLQQEGIDPARVEFAPLQSRRTYLELYHRIDLGLDSFPYNGHTTSLDSFWMGVPVGTLVGQRVVARAGWCQLSNLGLVELAGQTPEEFVRIAVELAKDLPRLKELRSNLRSRMEQSPLMDSRKFASSIEAAYRQMWRNWRENASARS